MDDLEDMSEDEVRRELMLVVAIHIIVAVTVITVLWLMMRFQPVEPDTFDRIWVSTCGIGGYL